MDANHHLWILPLLPLLGAAINGFTGKRRSLAGIGGIACGTVGLAFLYALYLFFTSAYAYTANVGFNFDTIQVLVTWTGGSAGEIAAG